jgi:hypothetical protein
MLPGCEALCSIVCTAFYTPFGNFKFCVMPFGLCCAPATVSYLMDEVFRDPAKIVGVEVDVNTFIAVCFGLFLYFH